MYTASSSMPSVVASGGGDVLGGGGLVTGLLFGALLGGNGFGGNQRATELMLIQQGQMDTNTNIANGVNSITNAITTGNYALFNQLADIRQEVAETRHRAVEESLRSANNNLVAVNGIASQNSNIQQQNLSNALLGSYATGTQQMIALGSTITNSAQVR